MSPPSLTRVLPAPLHHDHHWARHSSEPPSSLMCPTTDSSNRQRLMFFTRQQPQRNAITLDLGHERPHHSRASSSSRSCSRSHFCSQDEYNTSFSFSAKVSLICNIFTAELSMQECPPTTQCSVPMECANGVCQCECWQPTSIIHIAQASFLAMEPICCTISKTPTGTCYRVRILSTSLADATSLSLSTFLKKPHFWDCFYRISGELDSTSWPVCPASFA